MLKKTFLIFLLNVFAFSGLVLALPDYGGFVNDFEGIIENRDELENKISTFEKETTIEIVVLTTSDFADTNIEDYAVKVFEKWGIGKKDKDNGVLIIVSKEQKQSRIEVGYGLEGVLTDGVTGRIQDNAMIPHFKENNYSLGINNGVNMIMEILKGEETEGATNGSEEGGGYWVLGLILTGFLFLIANPFITGTIGAVAGFVLGVVFGSWPLGFVGAIIGGFVGFIFGLIAKLIPAPIRYGIASTMISSANRGGGRSFGGGSSGGGGSSRSW